MINLAKVTKNYYSSIIQNSLNVNYDDEDLISFALGLPSNDAFPMNLLQHSALSLKDKVNMQYSCSIKFLKTQIKDLVKKRGIICEEEEIFITAGAQQGISLLLRLIVNNGDKVVCESVTYPGFLQAAHSISVKIIAIPSNYETGIDLNVLEEKIVKTKPVIIYIVTDGSNPMGVTLSFEKRKKLVEIAKKYKIPILEDDPYGFLSYEQNGLLALKAFDKDNVLYIGSFSKIIAPALRVGWVIVPKEIVPKLAQLKESSDINTVTFSQRILEKFIEDMHLYTHLTKINNIYKSKRDYMNYCIKKYLPSSVRYVVPAHGIFFWLEFERFINTELLFQKALEKKLMILPGNAFSADGKNVGNNALRLNFSYSTFEQIEEGFRRLSLIKELVSNDIEHVYVK